MAFVDVCVRRGDRHVHLGGSSALVSVKDGRSCHLSSNDPLNDGKVYGAVDVQTPSTSVLSKFGFREIDLSMFKIGGKAFSVRRPLATLRACFFDSR